MELKIKKKNENDEIDYIIKLYSLHLDNLHRYNNTIWQLPTAVVSINILSILHFRDLPYIPLCISIISFAFIFAMFKHVSIQHSIVKAMINVEQELRIRFRSMIPEVREDNYFNKYFFKYRSSFILACVLFIANIMLFLYFSLRIFKII